MNSKILDMRHFYFLNVQIYNQMKHFIDNKALFNDHLDVSPSTCRSLFLLVIVLTHLYVSTNPRFPSCYQS